MKDAEGGWIQGDKGLERTIGATYLNEAIKADLKLSRYWQVVDTICVLKRDFKNWQDENAKKSQEDFLTWSARSSYNNEKIDFAQWKEQKSNDRYKNDSSTIKVSINFDPNFKSILTINSDDFISFSKNAGEKDNSRIIPDTNILKEITAYNDLTGQVNFRIDDFNQKLIVIDTEYSSFSSIGAEPISDQTATLLGGMTFEIPLADLI